MLTEGPKGGHRVRKIASESASAVAAGFIGIVPSLAEIIAPGASLPISLASGGMAYLFTRHAEQQTERLLEDLRERISGLELDGKLDRERLVKLEEELGGLQVIAANAVSGAEKVEVYASFMAGLVSTDAGEVDIASLLSVLQTLSRREIDIAKLMFEVWRSDTDSQSYGVFPPAGGADTRYQMKKLEAAGLVVPVVQAADVQRQDRYELTPTLQRLMTLLEAGRPA